MKLNIPLKGVNKNVQRVSKRNQNVIKKMSIKRSKSTKKCKNNMQQIVSSFLPRTSFYHISTTFLEEAAAKPRKATKPQLHGQAAKLLIGTEFV